MSNVPFMTDRERLQTYTSRYSGAGCLKGLFGVGILAEGDLQLRHSFYPGLMSVT